MQRSRPRFTPQRRTRLTLPPGEEPSASLELEEAGELYSPGFALPREPAPPSRWRWLIVSMVVLVVFVLGAYGMVRLIGSGRSEDPGLTERPGETATTKR